MSFEVVPAHDLPLGEQAKVFSDAFADYLVGSMEMDAPGLARFLCAQGADLCYSRFVRAKSGELVCFGYINRTGTVPRLAGMGTVPAARRTGAAAHLLSQLLDEARSRGDEAMVLEVFEQNSPAHSLYRRHGFRELTRLFGWRHQNGSAETETKHLHEISLSAAIRMHSAFEYPEIPWQISRHAVAKLPAACAFCLDDVCVIIGNPEMQPIRMHAFLGHDGNDWNATRQVVAKLLGKFWQSEFLAPAIFPEQFGTEIFAPLGFVREPLNQFLMRQDL